MREIIGIFIPIVATLCVAYFLAIFGLVLPDVSAMLENVPAWIWSVILLSLTISVYRYRCY
jgi:hypothetical protein